jgi:hypothetical protein
VAAISPTMVQWVMQNFQKRLRECANKDATLHTLYSGSVYCIKMFWDKDNFSNNSRKKVVYFLFYFNLKIIRFFCRTLYNTRRDGLNLLKPTGYVMHRQFNIQQLYALPTLYLCVLLFIWEQTATDATYSINWLVFVTEMISVYSAVRTGSLNTAVCASSLKG